MIRIFLFWRLTNYFHIMWNFLNFRLFNSNCYIFSLLGVSLYLKGLLDFLLSQFCSEFFLFSWNILRDIAFIFCVFFLLFITTFLDISVLFICFFIVDQLLFLLKFLALSFVVPFPLTIWTNLFLQCLFISYTITIF